MCRFSCFFAFLLSFPCIYKQEKEGKSKFSVAEDICGRVTRYELLWVGSHSSLYFIDPTQGRKFSRVQFLPKITGHGCRLFLVRYAKVYICIISLDHFYFNIP